MEAAGSIADTLLPRPSIPDPANREMLAARNFAAVVVTEIGCRHGN
jgi:hypothetical protein